jgi:hypothetical protein
MARWVGSFLFARGDRMEQNVTFFARRVWGLPISGSKCSFLVGYDYGFQLKGKC